MLARTVRASWRFLAELVSSVRLPSTVENIEPRKTTTIDKITVATSTSIRVNAPARDVALSVTRWRVASVGLERISVKNQKPGNSATAWENRFTNPAGRLQKHGAFIGKRGGTR